MFKATSLYFPCPKIRKEEENSRINNFFSENKMKGEYMTPHKIGENTTYDHLAVWGSGKYGL